jgi:hypothetical protein
MGRWNLQADLLGDEIVISLPGTVYAVAYYKPANQPPAHCERPDVGNSSISAVAILPTMTAAPTTSAGLFCLWGL